MKRVLTAAALIPFVIYVVLWAPLLLFSAVLAIAALLSYREYNSIAEAYGFGSPGPLGYVAGLLLLFWPAETWVLLVIVALLTLALVLRDPDLAKALPRAALLVLGVVYLFGAWKSAIPLRTLSPHWLMYGLVLNWAGDIGAYYVGRSFGKHRLAPVVSPNKSWEGAVASVITAVAVAGPYLLWFAPGFGIPQALTLTAVANVAGQFGDLCESAMKRGAGVKDSGNLLPGHGGFLDRVDSTLFALPVIYAWLRLRG
jgi:phosphatidate cytidylyltransferase